MSDPLRSRELIARRIDLGFAPDVAPPAAFAAVIRSESAERTQVIRDLVPVE